MRALPDRCYAVVDEPRRAAPHEDISMLDAEAARRIGPTKRAEQKCCGKAERDRDDGVSVVQLIFVLVEREPRADCVAVDETGVRLEARKASSGSGALREGEERWRHRGPWPAGDGIERRVAVARA